MTINTTASSITYQGNGATTAFTYGFLIPAAADVIVSLTEIATSIVTVLNPSVYSITGLNDPAGGTLTYPLTGSPLAATFYITVQRSLLLTQPVDLTNQDGFFPDVVENVFDTLCMQTQQMQEQLNRAVIAPVGTSTDIPALTAAILGAAGNATAAQSSATAAAASAASILAALPIGIELDWPGTVAPSLWLLEYGQVVAQATYPELFAVLGTTYNTGGEGAGNFRLPDLRGFVTAGKTDMGGSDSGNLTGGTVLNASLGSQTVTLTTAQLAVTTPAGTIGSITPAGSIAIGGGTVGGTLNIGNPAGGGGSPFTGAAITATFTGTPVTPVFTGSAFGSGTAHSNVQPTRIRNKIIFAGR